MSGGTLLVSRAEKLFPYLKQRLEAMNFQNVNITAEEKDSLNIVINDLKPRLLLVGSCFYEAATPYMLGQLLLCFPRLNIAVINMQRYPIYRAPWFIWYGAKSYVTVHEGLEDFYSGMDEIRKGHTYISPTVNRLLEASEWPEIKRKAEKRQMEVLILLCNGILPSEVGERLHISKRTVEWHIEELKKVFGVEKREELVSMAFYLEIVSKDDLCFFCRKEKPPALPKWALIKSAAKQ